MTLRTIADLPQISSKTRNLRRVKADSWGPQRAAPRRGNVFVDEKYGRVHLTGGCPDCPDAERQVTFDRGENSPRRG